MRKALVALLLIVVLVPAAAVFGAGALLDSGAVRARVAGAVQRATGHELRIDGPVRVAWSLVPAVAADRVALLNTPGFSRPELATVQRIEARLALLPLLGGRVEVRSVTLEHPDVLLERDAAGRGNWLPPPAPPAPAGPAPAEPRARTAVELGRLSVTEGRVALRGGPAADIPALSLAPAGGPVEGAVVFNGVRFVLSGTTGALTQPGASVAVSAVGGGLALTVSGQAGAAMALTVLAPDLSALAPLVGRPVPALRDVRLTAEAGPAGLGALRLVAGASDLGGVRLARLDVSAPALDEPVRGTAELAVGGLPVAVTVNAASLRAVLAAGQGGAPAAVQALALADGATLGGQGSVGQQGIEMTVSARVPDLRRTGALAGLALPPVRDGALDVRLLPGPGGLLARGLRVSMAQGDLAGDVAMGVTPRPFLRGSLVSQRIDLDALLTPMPAAPAAPASPPGPPPAPAGRVIPDRALPFAALRQADADLRVTVGQAVLGGAELRGIEARVLLQDGRLRADPLAMTGPGGAVQGQLLADATASPPTAGLVLRGAGLDAAPIAAALGRPGAVTGAIDLDIQLQGAGADLRAMAAAVQGRVGAALVEGEVDNLALAALFGPALQAANLPIEPGGRSRVRCLAARLDLGGGRATMKALAIDTTRLRMDGDGTMNLVDETLDLHLRPTLRLGAAGVQTPVRVQGPWRLPVPTMERGAGGRFGLSIGVAAADPCGPALAAARDGRAGAMPR